MRVVREPQRKRKKEKQSGLSEKGQCVWFDVTMEVLYDQ
jgi:hypothetical protein